MKDCDLQWKQENDIEDHKVSQVEVVNAQRPLYIENSCPPIQVANYKGYFSHYQSIWHSPWPSNKDSSDTVQYDNVSGIQVVFPTLITINR